MSDPMERLMEDQNQCAVCRGLMQGLELRSMELYIRSDEEKAKQKLRAICLEGHLERMHGWKREEELVA